MIKGSKGLAAHLARLMAWLGEEARLERRLGRLRQLVLGALQLGEHRLVGARVGHVVVRRRRAVLLPEVAAPLILLDRQLLDLAAQPPQRVLLDGLRGGSGGWLPSGRRRGLALGLDGRAQVHQRRRWAVSSLGSCPSRLARLGRAARPHAHGARRRGCRCSRTHARRARQCGCWRGRMPGAAWRRAGAATVARRGRHCLRACKTSMHKASGSCPA